MPPPLTRRRPPTPRERVAYRCPTCGARFYRGAKNSARRVKYCSRRCSGRARAAAFGRAPYRLM